MLYVIIYIIGDPAILSDGEEDKTADPAGGGDATTAVGDTGEDTATGIILL